MKPKQPSTYLWENICSLLRMKDPSVDAVKEQLKNVSRGTVQRAREQDGHRKTDQLALIAENFGIEVWQLLVPGVDPDDLPRLTADTDHAQQWPFTPALLAAALKADDAMRCRAENAARMVLGLDAIAGTANEVAA